jgi:hypothetical protein
VEKSVTLASLAGVHNRVIDTSADKHKMCDISQHWHWFRVLVAAGADGQLVGIFLLERS